MSPPSLFASQTWFFLVGNRIKSNRCYFSKWPLYLLFSLLNIMITVFANCINRDLFDCCDGDYFHLGGHDGDRSQLPLQGTDRQASSSLDAKVCHSQQFSPTRRTSISRHFWCSLKPKWNGKADGELLDAEWKMMNCLQTGDYAERTGSMNLSYNFHFILPFQICSEIRSWKV